MAANSDREFDVIVFGASGFTGAYVVEEMAISMEMESLYKSNNLKWAIAGRNHEKLKHVLKEVATRTKYDWVNKVPIILADTSDQKSLNEMSRRARLVISVVGPYRFYGEPVVKACVESATHYVDISGEPQFLESMQLKYNDAAKEKGIYIVGATGWDSIPADLGLSWTKQNFHGDLNHADILIGLKNENNDNKCLNYGTWNSLIYGYTYLHELKQLRKKLFSSNELLKQPQTKPKYKPEVKSILTYNDDFKGFCFPFPGSDKSVVRRSENYKYNVHKERPVQVEVYSLITSWTGLLKVFLTAFAIGIFAKFSFGRTLLKRYASFFSFGVISKGYGWDKKLDDPDQHHDTPPTKKIVTRISGVDPGYTATSSFVVHSAMTIIFDQHLMPGPGVLTPGACFSKTYLVDRLTKRNIKFEIVEKS